MIHENFVIFGAIIFFFGSVGYFLETISGKVKPNRVTWFLWSLAPFIAFFAQIKQGVGIQALLTFMIGFIPLMIFIASFVNKKSYWKLEKLDLTCGVISIIGLILWLITKNGNIAILFSLISDAMAAMPTAIKSLKRPETENYMLYLTNAVFAALTLLTIKEWTFNVYSFPLYMLVMTGSIAVFIKFKVGKYIFK
ncbi:MAG: hypothetical protein UR89_C0016G0009 [Candidatus Roizmanbacteria bacterium GW2011_GWA2_35_8]|uniref:Uncharacterized protein n=1 Tax=Candidatus Roizmanbacteria bacterium GW2011_GWA2_35_8 TaxID=1618479 RepID=A0A0G0FGS8_9BACT|nr:MAG: hypothetical protein UR89_C0016G0009 [Candidatus Roizmanbacteria bacterium GW2011_GWA2_35_8]